MHIVSGKLRKEPFIKDGCGQDGQSKMYVVELAEVNKDWQTQEKTYTNYKAMFFAKTDGAKAFYDKAFAEGSFIVVAAEKLKVDQFQSDAGVTYITLNMENARLESCLPLVDQGQLQGQQNYGNAPQAQQAAPQMAPAYQQQAAPTQQAAPQHKPQLTPAQVRAQQQAQAQQPQQAPDMNFDEDIPFK